MHSKKDGLNNPEEFTEMSEKVSQIDLHNNEHWRTARPMGLTSIPKIDTRTGHSDYLTTSMKEDKFLNDAYDNGGEVIISNNKLLFRGANNRITVIGTVRVVNGEKRVYKSPFAKAFIKENTDELVDNWAKQNGYIVWKEDFGNSYEGGGSPKNEVYIEFLNKSKNFTKDKKSFKTYKDAEKWARKNFDKFNPDMIHYYSGGGSTKPNPTKNMNHDNLMNRSDFTAYVNINDYPYTATVRNLNSFRNYLNRKDEKFTPNVFGEITYISDNASDEWVYQLQNLIDEKKYELQTYYNGGMTRNEHILESFLTSNKNAKVNNLSTHYAENENQILLRNYGTLIAIRRGNDVEITSKKYSVTTTKIQNALQRMANNMGMNVSRVDGFEAGGQLDSVSDMLPHSEPMGVIQPMNIMETVQPMYDEGGYIVQDSWRKSGIGNLSLEETKKVAKKYAEALSIASNDTFAVNKKTIEPNSFDLDMNDGDGLESYEYDGGSYNIYGDGSVVNVAVSPSARYGSVDNTVNEIVAKLKDLQKQFDNAEWKDKKNWEGKVYTQELVTEIKYAGGGLTYIDTEYDLESAEKRVEKLKKSGKYRRVQKRKNVYPTHTPSGKRSSRGSAGTFYRIWAEPKNYAGGGEIKLGDVMQVTVPEHKWKTKGGDKTNWYKTKGKVVGFHTLKDKSRSIVFEVENPNKSQAENKPTLKYSIAEKDLDKKTTYAGGGGVNDDWKKRYEEYREREIAKQEEEEKDKTFKKYIVNVYEQKKSGGYPFTSHETDNFLEAVGFGTAKMKQQRRYRSESDPLWVSISKFVPIRKRGNVFYAYNDLVHYNEKDMEYYKNSFDTGGQTNFEIEKDDSDYSDNFYKMLEEKRQQELIIQMKIATIMGIDEAIRLKDSDFVIHPFNLIQGAVRKGFIDVEQINKALIDASQNEAYHIDSIYRDSGHGIGSSDMNAFISSMLRSAGIQEKDYAKGGEVVEIFINDSPYYIRKGGDTTHFFMGNDAEFVGSQFATSHHIGQHKGSEYYEDLRTWLKGGSNGEIYGKKYSDKTGYYAKGGMTQGYNDRMDESLGMRHKGHHSQTHKDRRDEAKGMNKGMGNRAYQSVGTMDKMNNGGGVGSDLTDQEKLRFLTFYDRFIWHNGRDWANEYTPNKKGFLELKKDLSRIEAKYGNKLSDFEDDRLWSGTTVDSKWNYYVEKREDALGEAKTFAKGGALKPIPEGNKGLPKLPEDVRNRMGYMEYGGVAEKRQQYEAERQMKRTVLNDTTHKLINKNGSDINKYSAYDLKTLKSYISERDISEKMAQNVWGLAIQNGFEGYRSKVLILNSGTGNILNYVDDEFNRVDAVNPDKTENIIAGLLNDEESINIHTDSLKTLNKYDLAIILDVDNQIINGNKRDSLKLVTNKLNPNNLLIFVTIHLGLNPRKMIQGENANTKYINNNYRMVSAFNDDTKMISVLKRL